MSEVPPSSPPERLPLPPRNSPGGFRIGGIRLSVGRKANPAPPTMTSQRASVQLPSAVLQRLPSSSSAHWIPQPAPTVPAHATSVRESRELQGSVVGPPAPAPVPLPPQPVSPPTWPTSTTSTPAVVPLRPRRSMRPVAPPAYAPPLPTTPLSNAPRFITHAHDLQRKPPASSSAMQNSSDDGTEKWSTINDDSMLRESSSAAQMFRHQEADKTVAVGKAEEDPGEEADPEVLVAEEAEAEVLSSEERPAQEGMADEEFSEGDVAEDQEDKDSEPWEGITADANAEETSWEQTCDNNVDDESQLSLVQHTASSRHVPGGLTAAEAMAAPIAQRYLQTLTASQRAALGRVLQAVYGAGGMLDAYSSATYSRFCVSNSWDEKKTMKKVLKCVAWRTKGTGTGVDQIRAELLAGVKFLQLSNGVGLAVAKMNVFLPGHPFLGVTRQGDPFEVCVPGRIGSNKIEGRGLMQATTDAEFWTSNLAFMEYRALKFDRLCLEGDLQLKSLYMLSDIGGFTFSATFLRKVHKRFSRTAPIADLYYPLYLRKSVMINAPSSVGTIYKMFKPLLSKQITDTFCIFGPKDSTKAYAILASDIDASIVPECYGGKLTALTADMYDEIGLDGIAPELFALQFGAPRANLGQFHLPRPSGH